MKTQEIIKALRSTPSRSKRTLLDKAADRLEQLQNRKRCTLSGGDGQQKGIGVAE